MTEATKRTVEVTRIFPCWWIFRKLVSLAVVFMPDGVSFTVNKEIMK